MAEALVAQRRMAINRKNVNELLRERLGFAPTLTPIVILLGLAFLVASVPTLFSRLAGLEIEQPHIRAAIAALDQFGQRLADAQNRPSVVAVTDRVTQAGLVAAAVVIVAAGVRSLRAKKFLPMGLAVSGMLIGTVGLPLVAWLYLITVWLARLAVAIAGAVQRFVEWASPVLRIAVVAAVAAVVLFGLYSLIRFIFDEGYVTVAAIGVGAIVIGVVLVRVGVLDWLVDFIQEVVAAIGRFVDRWVVPVISWIVTIALVMLIALAVLGAAVGTLGQLGRTLFVPIFTAKKAGREARACADLAVGLGLSLCILLCGATLDESFGRRLETVWAATPLLNELPAPTSGYHLLIPDSVERWAAPGFNGYQPLLDATLLLTIGAVGVLALVFSSNEWTSEAAISTALPVLTALGLGLAVLLPLVLLMILTSDKSGP